MGNAWDEDEWRLTRRKFVAGAGVAGLLGFFAYLSWPAQLETPRSHIRASRATANEGINGLELTVNANYVMLPAAEAGKDYATSIVLNIGRAKQDAWKQYSPLQAELRSAEGWQLAETTFSEEGDRATTEFEPPIECIKLHGATYRVLGYNLDARKPEPLLEVTLDYQAPRIPLRAELTCDEDALRQVKFALLHEHRVLGQADKIGVRGIAFDWQGTGIEKRGPVTLKTLQHNHRFMDEDIDTKFIGGTTLTFDKPRDFNYLQGTQYWLEAGGAEILRVKLK
jgi:hypothetical protein